jgi:hypothetical protein
MFPLLLALAAGLPAVAAPAAPESERAALQPILTQDTRLTRPVTLRLKKSPLSTVAAVLSRETGVSMTAARDVADEPAIVYATEQPAKEVMHQLAQVFNCRWTRKGQPGAYAYEIYQDLKSRQEEEALRERDRLLALQALQAEFRDYLDWTRRPPEELRKAAAEYDALARQMAQTPPEQRAPLEKRWEPLYKARLMVNSVDRALIRVAASFTPAQWSALLNGEKLRFSTRTEAGFRPLSSALAAEVRAARPSQAGHVFDPHPTPEREASRRQYEEQQQRGWASADAIRIVFSINLDNQETDANSTQTASLRMETQPVIAPRNGYAASEVLGVTGRSAKVLEVPPRADPSAATDPVFGQKRRVTIDLPTRNQNWHRVEWLNRILPRIAETYGINLVADAYRHPHYRLAALPSGEERPLYAVLDELVLPVARWSRDGEFLRVRQHNWYQSRLAEIPERILRPWVNRLRQEPRLTLEDATTLVLSLRDEQVRSFGAVLRDEGIQISPMFTGDMEYHRNDLRVYGSLTPGQRQALLAGGKVAYAAMPAEARQWLERVLDKRDAPIEERNTGFLTLRVEQVERVANATPEGITILYRTAPAPDAAGDAPFQARHLRTENTGAELVAFGSPPLGSARLEWARFRYEFGAAPTRVDYTFEPPWVRVETEPKREDRPAVPAP